MWVTRANSHALTVHPKVVTICCLLGFCFVSAHGQSSRPDFEWIDAHAHVYTPSPELFEMLRRWDMRIVNIAVVDKHQSLDPRERAIFMDDAVQNRLTLQVFRQSRDRAPWISTFDPESWESPQFGARVIQQLDRTFKEGAVGVKIYKSIGMELKSTKTGRYLMPDDPVFDPILEYIARRGKTLYAHIAEPDFEWVPMDPNSPSYKKDDQFWNIYDHPDRPAKATILAARDHMLEKHPRLRVIGCHLGSMENDVDEIAARFDRYPNFAVDTSGRLDDLARQPRDKVRAFLIKYQDRVLYGRDDTVFPWQDARAQIQAWERDYALDWKFFATAETVVLEDRTVKGLALPEPVLRKIFHDNAIRWVPGIPTAPAQHSAARL
jgi:predicted TIM-barrel fold metal-dependent hydrolase